MKRFTATTTVNISFDEWILQAKRFATIDDVVNSNSLALDTPTSGVASIEVSYEKPLSTGFKGRVIYWQHYTKEQEQAVLGVDGIPTGVTQPVTVNARHKVVDYNMNLTAAEIEAMIDQAMPAVPDSVTGYFAREREAIKLVIMGDIVSKATFNLAADKWMIS